MTVATVSNLSTTQLLASQLENQSSSLNALSEQLASQQKYSNLTDYDPTDALNLMNLQSSATQKQAYLSVISTTQSRLSGYDTTMTDMESIISQASALVDGSQNYDASTAPNIAVTAENYLKSVQLDLNQQVNGRYIYAGSRYTTAPVSNLTALTDTPSATTTSSPVLPDYDTDYAASQLTLTTSGQSLTIGGTVTTPQQVSMDVSGTTYTYTVQSTDTTATIAAGLAALIPGATNTPGTSVVTVGGTNTIESSSADITSSAAYTLDSATIDTGDTVQYGVTSDAPAFQQLIAGLRFLAAAGNSTNAATYSANMTQASSLLTSALSGVQNLHTGVADNINTLTTETTTQNTQITNLSNQIDDIQNVNVTQVSAEITALQTILEASYTVTGDLEKLTLAAYL